MFELSLSDCQDTIVAMGYLHNHYRLRSAIASPSSFCGIKWPWFSIPIKKSIHWKWFFTHTKMDNIPLHVTHESISIKTVNCSWFIKPWFKVLCKTSIDCKADFDCFELLPRPVFFSNDWSNWDFIRAVLLPKDYLCFTWKLWKLAVLHGLS